MPLAPAFFLVVIGWDSNNLLTNTNALSSPLLRISKGCSTCTGGKRLVQQINGPALIATDAKEMYVLGFDSEADADAWVSASPNVFLGKQVYGYTPNWSTP